MPDLKDIYTKKFNISEGTAELSCEIERCVDEAFKIVDLNCQNISLKVIKAFQDSRISEAHFQISTGYGYDDVGREAVEEVFSRIFGTEDALVRHNIISGTHALSLCLFGVLRPGDEMLSVTGDVYDSLRKTISYGKKGFGCLEDFGINFCKTDLIISQTGDVDFNYQQIRKSLSSNTKVVFIQKSKGYNFRRALSNKKIAELIDYIKNIDDNIICIVDNCYGEFVEEYEPSDFGADLVAGSLIKNPGGGIMPTGGYIVGKKRYIELVSYKLNAVGLGKDCGASLGFSKGILQGVFMAPLIVSQALKIGIFTAALFGKVGFEVLPSYNCERFDIVQAVKLHDKKKLLDFCDCIQKGSAVDSFVTPTPFPMPGYNCDIVMAAGTFNQGASIELSADAPVVDPYVVYLQGGLSYHCGKIAVLRAFDMMTS